MSLIDNLRQIVKIAKRILTEEMLEGQLAGQNKVAPPVLRMKEENEQKHRIMVLNKSNRMGV